MNQPTSHRPHTIAEGGNRVWVYPQEVSGRFMRLRVLIAVPLLILFYALPWSTWHGNPILRLSLSSQSFYFLGSQLLIYEFYHFLLLFLLAILVLFLMSAMAGRVWCGYACPQTVFIEQILRRIERLVEGPAAKRKLNDQKNQTWSSLGRKITKQSLFFLVSLSFAFTAVGYFTDPLKIITHPSLSALGAIISLTAMAWFDGAYWREQFCHMVCPYARLQSVMQSKASFTIGYDASRGEPRRRTKNRDGAGDCIDCGLCVRVCPSGIDIRQGVNQLECIACARCIDGCDGIMRSVGKAPGLIRYDREENFNGGKLDNHLIKPLMRPRVLVLSFLCFSLFIGGLYGFWGRARFHSQILTVPGLPFVNEGQRIKNIYTLKLGNQSGQAVTLQVSLIGDGAKIESPTQLGVLNAGEEKIFPFLFSIDRHSQLQNVIIRVTSAQGEVVMESTRPILRPGKGDL